MTTTTNTVSLPLSRRLSRLAIYLVLRFNGLI